MISVKKYGASPYLSDNHSAFQAALNEHMETGEPVHIPSGAYNIGSTLQYVTQSNATFTPGLRIVGDGMLRSELVNNSGGNLFNVTTTTPLKFQMGGLIDGISISGSAPGNCGISLRRAYNYTLSNLRINGMAADGLRLICADGDGDACNNIVLNQVRIENCLNWGINTINGLGVNETSFLTMQNTFVQNCGTLDGVGGGMYWRGQALKLDQTCFVLNKNRGLYIEGGAGLGNTVVGINTVFENNSGKALECWGVQGLTLTRSQIYANDSCYEGSGKGYLCYFNGVETVVRNILLDGIVVRVTSVNTPLTAFFAAGSNADQLSIRVKDVTWANFDYPGQIRSSGLSLS